MNKNIASRLDALQDFCNSITESNSTKAKKATAGALLPDNEAIQKLLNYTYNEIDFVYGITPKTLKKKENLCSPEVAVKYASLEDLLEDLHHRRITGHAAIATVNGFCSLYPNYTALVHRILDRNLMIGMSAGSFNEIVPGLIKVFLCALGKDYNQKYVDRGGKWVISRKLDGVRDFMQLDGGAVTHTSRGGLSYEAFDEINPVVAKFIADNNLGDHILDGEMVWMEDNGVENFRALSKFLQVKGFTAPLANIRYKVFDILTKEEFAAGTSTRKLEERLAAAKGLDWSGVGEYLELIEQVPYTDEKLAEMRLSSLTGKWEGLIVRRADAPYIGDRSSDILKDKVFKEEEYICTGMTKEIYPYFVDGPTGKERAEEMMLNAAIIDYKGFPVNVGSGWSVDERKKYYANPELLVGNPITVRHFGESQDENGNLSLRFPTLMSVHESGKRTT